MSDSTPAKRRGRPPKQRAAPDVHGVCERAEPHDQEAEGKASSVEATSSLDEQHAKADVGEQLHGLVSDDPDENPRRVHRPSIGLSDHERHGLIEEALYTHEMQLEFIRFDSKNRKWTFKPEARNNRANLLIHLRRGPDEREALIDNAKFGADNVRDDVEAAIDLLDEALS